MVGRLQASGLLRKNDPRIQQTADIDLNCFWRLRASRSATTVLDNAGHDCKNDVENFHDYSIVVWPNPFTTSLTSQAFCIYDFVPRQHYTFSISDKLAWMKLQRQISGRSSRREPALTHSVLPKKSAFLCEILPRTIGAADSSHSRLSRSIGIAIPSAICRPCLRALRTTQSGSQKTMILPNEPTEPLISLGIVKKNEPQTTPIELK
jgi:hypothetical protein